MDDREILRAAMAVALADGELRRAEKGVLKGLARKAGIGETAFAAMLEEAQEKGADADHLMFLKPDTARTGLELLVALARIDGEIAPEERDVLVRIALDLRIAMDEFDTIYKRGIARADTIRESRKTK